jgi:hypothetical protein
VNAHESGMLHMQKTDTGNKGGCHYLTMHFFQTVVMVEKIYCALLADDNLVAFGTTAMI